MHIKRRSNAHIFTREQLTLLMRAGTDKTLDEIRKRLEDTYCPIAEIRLLDRSYHDGFVVVAARHDLRRIHSHKTREANVFLIAAQHARNHRVLNPHSSQLASFFRGFPESQGKFKITLNCHHRNRRKSQPSSRRRVQRVH